RCCSMYSYTISHNYVCLWQIFFFQAEDGIRDRNVTGVQTCALPILMSDQLKMSMLSKENRPKNASAIKIALISVMEFFLLNIYLCMLIPSNFIFICIPC